MLTLAALALALPQTPVEIAFEGTVPPTGSTLTEAPFATLTPGDPVEFRFEVETPGNLGGAGQFDIYPLVDASVELTIGGATATMGSSVSGCFFFDRSPGGPGDILTVTIDLASGATVTLTANDSTSTAWNSVDLLQNFGTYPASTFGLNLFQVEDTGGSLLADFGSLRIGPQMNSLGTPFCAPGALNSTGAPGTLTAQGSDLVADNDVTLTASGLPADLFGIFLTGQTTVAPMQPMNSMGNLCLGGSVGRYTAPGQVQSAGAAGSFSLNLDLAQTPQPTAFVQVMAGETWSFQAWHRDIVAGVPTSNFTEGLSITFM